MFKKMILLVISIFPIISHANFQHKDTRVYIEKDGKFHLVVNEEQIFEIIENSEVIELSPEDLEEIEMAGTLTESQEDPVER